MDGELIMETPLEVDDKITLSEVLDKLNLKLLAGFGETMSLFRGCEFLMVAEVNCFDKVWHYLAKNNLIKVKKINNEVIIKNSTIKGTGDAPLISGSNTKLSIDNDSVIQGFTEKEVICFFCDDVCNNNHQCCDKCWNKIKDKK